MDDSSTLSVSDDTSAADLLRAITSRQLEPTNLPPDARRRCVEYLTAQGYTVGESALTLATSERTIQRDRALLRKEHAMLPGVSLGDEMMGELRDTVAASNERLMRLCRDDNAPPYVKVWAENTIVKNQLQLIKQARELCYFADATPRLDEKIDEDPGTKRRAAKKHARTQAILRGENPDAQNEPEPFDPTTPQPVLDDTGIEQALDQTRERLAYLQRVIETDPEPTDEADRDDHEKHLAMIQHLRTHLDQAAAQLEDTIDMERDYRWELNGPDDDGGDGGDGGDDDPRSTRESPPPDLAA